MMHYRGGLLSLSFVMLALGSLPLAGCSPDKTAPEDVTNLDASTGDQQVALTWDASANTAGDLAGYKVYRDGVSIADVGATATGYTATGLANGTSYAFKVTALDAVPNESAGAAVSAYANPPLGPESFNADSGLADGGAVVGATQRMTGTLPNPSGKATEYGGKAYLVVNGDPIPLQVTQASSSKARRFIEKEGLIYPLVKADWFSPDFDWLAAAVDAEKSADTIWVFQVTFSINAGPNTLKIEVYDLDGSIFASTASWDVIGAIKPESMVVTLWWNTDKTDLDLHVSPDNGGTHCYYGNPSAGEMVLDYDVTTGFGPEHITVDNATTTATYKIKVYYFYDHNENADGSTTPTTCFVNARVNGKTKLNASSSLSVSKQDAIWADGAHIWNAGEVEVKSANRLDVTMGDPDLSNWPEVSLPLTVLNPARQNNGEEGLTPDNFYVVNAGTVMKPVTVSGGANGVYTLKFTDITAGKRNLFVYVYAPLPAAGAKAATVQEFMGGLSNTATYGTNYALLVGLNQYPPAATVVSNSTSIDANTFTSDVKPKIPAASAGVAVVGEFSATMTDEDGGTNRPPAAATVTGISNLGGGVFRLTISRPAVNGADYDTVSITYQKQAWLANSLNDMADLKTALLNTGTLASNNMWDSANITSLTDAAATRDAVLQAISDTAVVMEAYDAFLFAYSGHGSNGTNSGNEYLCTYENEAWTSVNDLQGKLGLIAEEGIVNTFVIIDACYSGNFAAKSLGDPAGAIIKSRPFLPQAEESKGHGMTFKGLTGGNLFVMTAVDGNHQAWDVGDLNNGAFMHYVVEGMSIAGKPLSAAAANTNHDTWVTAEEVYNYAKPKASAYVATNILPSNPGAAENPQVYPSASGKSRLVYNW